ncbi:MAG: kinase, partial [Gammaproteobacteria bacterium]|nr:kinase [Gammaproteobacteria bacterium]
MRLAGLAGITSSVEARSTWRALDPRAPEDYRQLAALLLDRWYEQGVQFVGIGGGQGAGKSTLGRLLVQAGELSGLSTCVLSIDDFYLPGADRLALARQVHPLLATRGPPGTHDVALCRSVLDALPYSREVAVPVFDKGRDDRTGSRTVAGYVDVVVLEGWCVGARPSPPELLAKPVNSLERERDADATWRNHVNDALATAYAELFEGLESLVYLQAPD